MVHLVNVFIEKLCVHQPVNVVEANFLQPIISAKLKNERRKAWHELSVVWHVISHDIVNEKECELCENYSDDELVHETVDKNLEKTEMNFQLHKNP